MDNWGIIGKRELKRNERHDMSLHFDFTLACILRPDTPQAVLDKLADMTKAEDWYANSPTDEPPASDYEISYQLRHWGAVHGFPGVFGSVLLNAHQYGVADKHIYRYTFCCRSRMLDDTFYQEWWEFAGWLAQYSETVGWVGYYREEDALHPTLLYFRDSKVYISEITQAPVGLLDGETW